MKNPDRLPFWPPGRSDLVMLVGLAIIVYAVIIKEWGVIGFGVLLLLAGFMVPRMKGKFLFRAPNLQFRGELVDPDDSDPTTRQRDEESAPRALPPPQAPPASSQRPEE